MVRSAAIEGSSGGGREAPRVRVVSPDAGFAGSIGARLHGWGASVEVESDFARIDPAASGEEQLDVVLVDVRRCDDGLLGWIAALKRAQPALQVILLNVPGHVATSIAAMRAGASTELSAPLDVATLRRTVADALRRRRRRLGDRRPSLLDRFRRAMTAAALAEGGEFDEARRILAEGEGPRRQRTRRTDRR